MKKRAEHFLKQNKIYQEKQTEVNQLTQAELINKINIIDESLKSIHQASDTISHYINYCFNHVTQTAQVFLSVVIITVVIVAGTLGWANYINHSLTEAKTELTRLDVKLRHKPVILRFQGNDYIRAIPNSETWDKGDKISGRYAKVWHVR